MNPDVSRLKIINMAVVPALHQLTRLEALEIDFCIKQPTDVITQVSTHSLLTSLKISNTFTQPHHIAQLNWPRNLAILNLKNNNITSFTLDVLPVACHTLILENNMIQLIRSTTVHSSLRHLSLCANILRTFPCLQCPNLHSLDLSYNQIKSLNQNLKSLSNLQVLDLTCNQLELENSAILEVLPQNVQKIGLSYNNVTELHPLKQVPLIVNTEKDVFNIAGNIYYTRLCGPYNTKMHKQLQITRYVTLYPFLPLNIKSPANECRLAYADFARADRLRAALLFCRYDKTLVSDAGGNSIHLCVFVALHLWIRGQYANAEVALHGLELSLNISTQVEFDECKKLIATCVKGQQELMSQENCLMC